MAAGLTLDAGALIAAEKRSPRFWAIWQERQLRHLRVTLPAVVLAQAWRGNSPIIARIQHACRTEHFDQIQARKVGELLAKSRTADVVDAVVVLGAVSRGDRIVTSDPKDIRRLLAAAGADESLGLEV
jgi:predicted nucleic acid-binding protein